MKVAVSAMKPSLNSPIDPRFGRCRYLVFIDAETMELEAVENPNVMSLMGAGPQTAQLVTNKGARVLLTGQLGPNTELALAAAGIEVVTGVEGTVAEAVARYKRSRRQPAASPAEPRVPTLGFAEEPSPYAGLGAPGQGSADLKSQLLAISRHLSEIQRRIDELAKTIP
jgi:predicted Fe-Mo cluster-binding NifX family protein